MVARILFKKYSITFLIGFTISSGSCNSIGESKLVDATVINLDSTKSVNRFNLHTNLKCERNDLSNQFNIAINFERYSDTIKFNDSNIIHVSLADKKTKIIFDTFSLTSFYYLGDSFANCDSVISYTTSINLNREIIDNYFGDFVVADLNFDKLDDIAIITDYSVDSGPYYSYFIQTKERKFVFDHYLTDSISFFPSKIDKSHNRVVTRVHSGACCVGVDTYQFYKSTQKWKHVSHILIPPSK